MLSNVDVSSWKFYPDALCSLAYSPLWTFNMYKLDALSYGFCGTLLDNNPVCSSVLSVTVKTSFFFFGSSVIFFSFSGAISECQSCLWFSNQSSYQTSTETKREEEKAKSRMLFVSNFVPCTSKSYLFYIWVPNMWRPLALYPPPQECSYMFH